MENTQGISPLQALQLTESLKGLSDQQFLNLIARHLVFSPEAGKSITGLAGAKGDSGAKGNDGNDGKDGKTPEVSIDIIDLAAGREFYDYPLPFNEVAKSSLTLAWVDPDNAAASNHHITYLSNLLTTTRVFFDSALVGDNWKIVRTYWS